METNKNNSYSDEIEIDLWEVVLMMWHHLWLIILCAVVAGVIGFCVSKFAITPMYESSTEVFVVDKKEGDASLTYTDLQMGTQLTKDYVQMIKSRTVLDQVIANLELNETYHSLQSRIAVTTPTEGRILEITVTDANPEMAQLIANEVLVAAGEHIKNVTETEAMNVVDYASLPLNPSSPSVKKWTALGFLLGAFLCMGVLLVKFLLDDTIKNSEDVERFLGMSTLAMIPLMDENEARKEKSRENKIIQSGVEEGMLDNSMVSPKEEAAEKSKEAKTEKKSDDAAADKKE